MQEKITGAGATLLSWVTTLTQANEVFRMIQLILSILCSVLVIISTIIIPWYKKAKKDGKITKDEVVELVDKVADAIDNNKEDGE